MAISPMRLIALTSVSDIALVTSCASFCRSACGSLEPFIAASRACMPRIEFDAVGIDGEVINEHLPGPLRLTACIRHRCHIGAGILDMRRTTGHAEQGGHDAEGGQNRDGALRHPSCGMTNF